MTVGEEFKLGEMSQIMIQVAAIHTNEVVRLQGKIKNLQYQYGSELGNLKKKEIYGVLFQ